MRSVFRADCVWLVWVWSRYCFLRGGGDYKNQHKQRKQKLLSFFRRHLGPLLLQKKWQQGGGQAVQSSARSSVRSIARSSGRPADRPSVRSPHYYHHRMHVQFLWLRCMLGAPLMVVPSVEGWMNSAVAGQHWTLGWRVWGFISQPHFLHYFVENYDVSFPFIYEDFSVDKY